jgi:hypothetical protein
MKYIYKLGNEAVSFTDVKLGISITKSAPLYSDDALHMQSSRLAKAIRGGHIFMEVQESEKPSLDQFDASTATEEQMLALTKKQLIEKFNFLDEEDAEKAEKAKNKASLVAFLIEAREDYELDNK